MAMKTQRVEEVGGQFYHWRDNGRLLFEEVAVINDTLHYRLMCMRCHQPITHGQVSVKTLETHRLWVCAE